MNYVLRGAYLVRNVKRVVVGRQTDVRLLFAVRAEERKEVRNKSIVILECEHTG